MKAYLGFVFLWLVLSGPRAAKWAFAHGDHDDAVPAHGGVSMIAIDGFEIELLTSPGPARVGRENKIVARIRRSGSLEPVRGGLVLIGVAPAPVPKAPLSPEGGSLRAFRPPPLHLLRAPEVVWAGNYTLIEEFDRVGLHQVRVALVELDGKKFDPPATVDFYLNVAAAPGVSARLAFVTVMALALGAAGVYWAVLRSRAGADFNASWNYLDIPWLGRLVRWRGFQPALQIPVLALTLVVTLLGFFDLQDAEKNLATKLTWIVWWPGIIFTFILVGRLWCVACPIGALNEWTAKLARPERMLPRALRNLWLATLFFVILTWADEQLGVIRSPRMTAWLIVFLALAAVATGLFFQRRTFCRYLCPITGLQGLYSMVSPVELRAADRGRCLRRCRQDCYRGNASGTGCPMFEFPMTMERNMYCNFCFECVKACPPENMALRVRPPGTDLWASAKRSLDEAYLAVALVGITTLLTAQMLTGWLDRIAQVARLVPVSVRAAMRPIAYLTLVESLALFLGALVLYPLIVHLAARLTAKREGKSGGFVTFGYMFVPIGLAMHLAHNVSHLFLEGPGVVPALRSALNRYTPFHLGEPDWQVDPLLPPEAVYWLQMFLVLGGLVFSLVVGYRLAARYYESRGAAGRVVVPFMLVSLLFTLVNLYLLNQPMGMRHGM